MLYLLWEQAATRPVKTIMYKYKKIHSIQYFYVHGKPCFPKDIGAVEKEKTGFNRSITAL